MNLVQILGIEAVKLNRLANYILLGLLVLIYAGAMWSSYYMFTKSGANVTTDMFFNNILQIENGVVGLFIALFIIINIGKEYADGTLRKNIIDGYTRQQFFTGKFAVLVLVTLLVFLIGKLAMLGSGLLINRFSEMTRLMSGTVVLKSLLDIAATAVFTLFLAFVTRSIVLSIVLYFVWNIVEGVLSMAARYLFDIEDLIRYLPLGSFKSTLAYGASADTWKTVAACTYSVLMIVIPYLLFLRRDIR